MNEFEQFLYGEAKVAVDPERIQLMAKQAAAKYLSEGASLNDSIKKLAADESLNDEQIKRVVERANTETFLGMFKRGYEKNIDFDVADHGTISAKDTKTKTAAARDHFTSSYVPGQEYVSLDEAFASETETVKEAGWDTTITQQYLSDRDMVKHAVEDLHDLSSQFEFAIDSVRREIDEAVDSGAEISEIASMLKHADVSRELAEVLFDGADLSKHAQHDVVVGEANENHPLYKEAFELVKVTKRFFGTLDHANGVIERSSSNVPGFDDLIQGTASAYFEYLD